jgi:multidrug resistance efflux pump
VILAWGMEKVEQERSDKEQAQQQATLEKQRADQAQIEVERLAELLRSQGIDPGAIG